MIRRPTWIVLILFLVVLTGTILWQKNKPQEQASTTPTPEAGQFFEIQAQDIVEFEVAQPSGTVVTVKSDASGTWLVEGFAAEETDTSRVESVRQQIASLTVLSTLEQDPAADLVGLTQPSYILRVKLADGSQKTGYVGNLTPTSSGYYARVEGGKMVVLSKYSLDSVVGILTTPPILPTQLPTETPTTTASPEIVPSVTPTP